jgi:type II secretory pathway pseudopilin PulG
MYTRRSDAGFSLAAVIFFATATSILIAAAVPVYQMQAKRQMEEELIFRGEEYTRAIQKYQRRFGVYPISVDQLLSTNGLRFLRRKYEDPISGKDFRLITVNPDGSLNGSKVFQQTPNGQQLFGNTAAFPSGTGAPNTNPNATPNSNSNLRRGGTSGGFMGTTNFGATNFGGTNFGAVPAAGPNASLPNSSGSSAAASSPPRPASGAAPPGTFMGNPTSVAGVNQGFGGANARNGQTFGSSGIVGVASDSDQASIKVYNNRQRYDEWEFIALFGAAAGAPGANGNPNANGVNGNFSGPATPGGNNLGGNRGANNPGANGFRSTNPFGGGGFNTPSPFGQTGTPFGAGPGTSPGTQTPFGVPTPQQQR